MASDLPDILFQSDRLIKRRYVQIPGDQRKLLEDEGAWSQNLSRGPRGMINIPPQVLQDVKDSHARQHCLSLQGSREPPPAPSSVKDGEAAHGSAGREQPPSSPLGDDETDGTHVVSSWPPTPIGRGRGQDYADEEPQKAGVQEARSPSPKEQHPSPIKANQFRRTRPLLFDDGPASSGAHSEGLEMEELSFLSQHNGPPVNRTALQATARASGRLGATPPSAQMPFGTSENVMQRPVKRQRRAEELPPGETASEPAPSEPAPSEPAPSALALKASPKLVPGRPDNNESSMTPSASTNFQATPQKHARIETPVMRSDPATCQEHSSFTPTYEGRSHSLLLPQQTGMPTAPGPSFAPPPAQRALDNQATAAAELTGASRSPYEAFKALYPDYTESRRRFVGACLTVNQLRRDRQLPEFLYDDFVRAQSSEYLDYVTESDRKKGDNLLPAIQWYNDTSKDPLYTKKLIRKDNLAAILEAHADEAHSLRRSLGDSQSTASDSGQEESDQEMQDAPEEGDPGDPGDQSEKEELIETIDDEEAPVSPQLMIASPGPRPARRAVRPTRIEDLADDGDLMNGRGSSRSDQSNSQADVDFEDAPEEQVEDEKGPAVSLVAVADEGHQADLTIDSPRRTKRTPTLGKKQKAPASIDGKASQGSRRGCRPTTAPVELVQPVSSSRPTPSKSDLLHAYRSEQERHEAPSARAPQHMKFSMGFRTQELSEDEHGVSDGKVDVTEPPVQNATALVENEKSLQTLPVSMTDATDRNSDSEEEAFEPLIKTAMLPPKALSRSSSTPKSRPTSAAAARPAYTATAAVASKPTALGSPVSNNDRRPSIASSLGFEPRRLRSPGSSERTYANISRSRKRSGESASQRSSRFKAFVKRRISSGTPSSTAASKK